jgi:hypothetical protein
MYAGIWINMILCSIHFIFSVSFDVADLDIHAWFRINVNIDTWEDISPADVSVENLFGTVRYVCFNLIQILCYIICIYVLFLITKLDWNTIP